MMRSVSAARMARPSATRWLSPPESVSGRRERRCAMPSTSMRRSWSTAVRRPPRRLPKSRFLRTVRCGKSLWDWKTKPMPRDSTGRSMHGSSDLKTRPLTLIVPDAGFTRSAMLPVSVDLPQLCQEKRVEGWMKTGRSEPPLRQAFWARAASISMTPSRTPAASA